MFFGFTYCEQRTPMFLHDSVYTPDISGHQMGVWWGGVPIPSNSSCMSDVVHLEIVLNPPG